MAILDWEGFDRDTANLGIFSQFLGNISNDGTGYDNYGRYFYRTTDLACYVARFLSFPNTATLFAQCHVKFTNHISEFRFGVLDGSTFQIYVRVGSNGVPAIVHGNGSVLATANQSLPLNVWSFLQLKVSIANHGGTAELRIQGKLVATYNGDTQYTANSYANGWKAERVSQGNTFGIDNILLYDTNGDPPNNWTPETRIYDSLPTGAGSTTQWSPSAGANWQCVDEQPSNGDTDYVSAAAAGLTDTYAVPSVATPGSIVYAVGVHVTARKDDAGANEIDGVLRSGVLDYAHGNPAGISTSYARYRWLWHKDPATGLAWTVAGANAAQPGIRRTT